MFSLVSSCFTILIGCHESRQSVSTRHVISRTYGHKQPQDGVPRPPRRRFDAVVRVHTATCRLWTKRRPADLWSKLKMGNRTSPSSRVETGRANEWCLPKGHLSAEKPPKPPVREIAEETGILGQIVSPLASIDYRFSSGIVVSMSFTTIFCNSLKET